jgi:NAD-dependent SIR2 family protein deacetylase
MKEQSLREFFERNDSVTVVSGAGVSTASGIPDYRDRNGNWKNAQPVQYSDFIASEHTRKRYWARSFAGWQRMSTARPNVAHTALADLEAAGRIGCLITQNVDGLHSAAGSRNVIDLHGVLSRVRCLACRETQRRETWQDALRTLNPDWRAAVSALRPDGDAELDKEACMEFRIPGCRYCGGTMKPDVVFFGENVPRRRVAEAVGAVDASDALLVVGSSLMVFSGYRFARRAAELDKPIAIVNRGKTRADDLAQLKIDDDCRDVLARAAAACG